VTSPAATRSFDEPYGGDLSSDLELALRLADTADAASMPRFDSADLDVRAKPDATFVTDADLATEEAIRAILTTERPQDGVLGEEFGVTGSGARQWIIDPIDGTHNYLRGIPMWTTLIALVIDGVPRVGVVSQPAISRRWWAASGLGAWTKSASGESARLGVSDVDAIERASVSFQSMQQWRDAGELPALERLTSAVWRDRGYGDAWPYMLLAEGRLELVAEFDVKEYDIAALVPIVVEAGGSFTAYSGNHSIAERSSLATNRVLHDAFLDLLHPSPA